eukprot:COSAG02_NODE_921_length_15917_cov_4.428057_1_plen_841_part_00
MRQRSIVLQIMRGQSIETATMTRSAVPLILDTGRWYHIAIIHRSAPRTIGQAEVVFYIDGQQTSPASVLKYPDIAGGMDGYICTSAVQSSGAGHRIIPAMPLCGQMSSLYFFDMAVSHTDVRSIHSLGPNYMYSFEATDDVLVAAETEDFIEDLQSTLASGLSAQIWLSYNAKACDGIVAFDTTPEGIGRTAGLNARLLGSTSASGTRSCVTRKLRDTITAMGGVKLLFPLFVHLRHLCSESSQTTHGSNRGTDSQAQALLNGIFTLFQKALVNRNNVNFMAQSNGFGVIQHLLRHVPAESFTVETLTFISDLGNSVLDTRLQALAHRCMLLDFHIWVNTAPPVQTEAIRQLRRICQANPSMFQELCGVQGLLDIVEQYYGSYPVKESLAVSSPPADTQRDASPRRASMHDVRTLRRQLLEILTTTMEQQYTNEDLQRVVAFLCCVDDGEILRDVVMELRALCQEQPRANAALKSSNNLVLLVKLLGHDHEPVRCETILLFASLVSFEDNVDPDKVLLLREIVLCVDNRAATDDVKRTLLCAALGSSGAQISDARESDEIKNPVFIHLLFNAHLQCLNETTTGTEARIAAWGELTLLLEATMAYFTSNVQNVAQFCSVDGWQEVCIPLLTIDDCPANIQDLFCLVFQTVHVHSFRYRTQGWNMLASSLAHLEAAESSGGEWLDLRRRFCVNVLQNIYRVIESGVWRPDMRGSISRIMLLAEDALFCHADSDGTAGAKHNISDNGSEPDELALDLAEAAWLLLDRQDLQFTDFVQDDDGLAHNFPGGLARTAIRIVVASIVENTESKSVGKYLQRLHKYLCGLPRSTDQTNAIHVYSMVRP